MPFQHGANTQVVTATALTRPANTTAYAANDAVSDSTSAPTAQTIAVGRMPSGTGTIHNAVLIDSNPAATPADFEVWLFSEAYTPVNDNAAWSVSDAEADTCIGIISLPTSTAYATALNRVFQAAGLDLPFQCASGTYNVYWALVVRGSLTPISGETFTLRLGVTRD